MTGRARVDIEVLVHNGLPMPRRRRPSGRMGEISVAGITRYSAEAALVINSMTSGAGSQVGLITMKDRGSGRHPTAGMWKCGMALETRDSAAATLVIRSVALPATGQSRCVGPDDIAVEYRGG